MPRRMPRRTRPARPAQQPEPRLRGGGAAQALVPYPNNVVKTDRLCLSPRVENLYHCQRSYGLSGITASNVSAVYGAYGFVASNLSDWTALSSCFDQYRIDIVEVIFQPRISAAISTTYDGGSFVTVIDYDDSTPLGSLQIAYDYTNKIQSGAYERQRRCFRPRIAIAAYGSGAFTSFANQRAGWIDCASGSVVHYGIKYALDQQGSAIQYYDVVATLQMTFRAGR